MATVASSTTSLSSSRTKSLHDFHLAPVLKSQLHKAFLHFLPLVINAQFLAALNGGSGADWVAGFTLACTNLIVHLAFLHDFVLREAELIVL